MTPSRISDWIQEGLFDQVPMQIAVIDKGFNIIKANALFEATYGPWQGKKCYQVYKKRKRQCSKCPALATFESGEVRTSEEQGTSKNGGATYYRVRFFPLRDDKGGIPFVVEMSSDVSERVAMAQEHSFLLENVPCYITVIDRNLKIIKSNKFFDDKFGRKGKTHCYEMYKASANPCANCPSIKAFETGETHSTLQEGIDRKGKKSHYMVTTAPLRRDGDGIASVIEIAHDVSEVLDLKTKLEKAEHEKLEAERLAAVGQTVAGLSHGIKNIIMGLEGGMYVVNSGLKRDDQTLTKEGWKMLESNITKISSFVAEFLSFAKGTEPTVRQVDPVKIAEEVVSLYEETAKRSGITLTGDYPQALKKASLDAEGIHTSLANLVSNAIDACLVSDKKKLKVVLSCRERNDTIYYRVEDNGCGMDYEVKKKIFTNFFTTKGSGQGTGLGLLVTRKIVSQHGGEITVETADGGGSVFTLEFPRKRLPKQTGK
ncbi:MAG: ATP-binding protein [Elusimicrobiota bacterium]